MHFYQIIIILVALFLSAIFVAYEMALASISRAQLTVLVNHKRRGAQESLFMKERMEASLAVIQVCFTFLSTITAAIGGASVTESLSPYLQKTFGLGDAPADIAALVLVIIPLSAITIIFGELIP